MGVLSRTCKQWTTAIEMVRRTRLPGSVHQLMALFDRPDSQPVRALAYIQGLLEEARSEPHPVSDWRHLEFDLRCFE